jgi:glycosyltransferase involved in cell wall biosynthesis
LALYAKGLQLFEEKEGFRVRRLKRWTNRIPGIRFIPFMRYGEFLWKVFRWYKEYDLMQCNDLETLPIGWLAKKWNPDIKVIYDAHEWEIDAVPNIPRWKQRLFYSVEKFLLPTRHAMFTVSESIAEEYMQVYGIPKPHVLMNCPYLSTQELTTGNDKFREIFPITKGQMIFLYQGGFSVGRGLEELVQTFQQRKDNAKVLVMMGYGPLEEMIKNASKESKCIFHLPAVSPAELPFYTSSADVGFLLTKNVCRSFYLSLPNKIFEYVQYGLPVIVNNLPEFVQICQKYGIGEVLHEVSVSSLSEMVDRIREDDLATYRKGLKEVSQKYNWEAQEKVYLEVYRQLIQ